eukprot:scaffold8552_cov267-Pinguiococcus_pyrenoidosus.AAC.1
MLLELLVGGPHEVVHGGHRVEHGLHFEQLQKAGRPRHEVDDGLVVLEGHHGGVQGLDPVLLLLEHEDVLIEMLLERLVRKVDAELLEAIQPHDLEAEDVENADEARRHVHRVHVPVLVVDLPHQPGEKVRVEELDAALHVVDAFGARQVLHRHAATPRRDHASGDRLLQVGWRRAQHLGDALDRHLAIHHAARLRAAIREEVVLGEIQVAHVQERGQHVLDLALLCSRDSELGHGGQGVLPLPAIIDAFADVEGLAHVAQPEGFGKAHVEGLALLGSEALRELVEDVVVALAILNLNEAALLQEEMLRLGADEAEVFAVEQADVLAEARRVVVAHRLGVAKGLQNHVRLDEHALDELGLLVFLHGDVLVDLGVFLALGRLAGILVLQLHLAREHLADGDQVAHDVLGRLRLSRSGFTGDDDGLVLRLALVVLLRQAAEGSIRNGVDVRALGVARDRLLLRRQHRIDVVDFLPCRGVTAHEQVHVHVVEQRDALVGVDGDEHVSDVGVDDVLVEAAAQEVQQRRLVQVVELGDVIQVQQVAGVEAVRFGQRILLLQAAS